jgi:hypothetical protein
MIWFITIAYFLITLSVLVVVGHDIYDRYFADPKNDTLYHIHINKDSGKKFKKTKKN